MTASRVVRAAVSMFISAFAFETAEASGFKNIYFFSHYITPYDHMSYHDGIVYGTSFYGGLRDDGSVFAVDTRSQKETVLHSFGSRRDSPYPEGTTFDRGSLYGFSDNNLYRISSTKGIYTLLYRFGGQNEPSGFETSPIAVGDVLYGVSDGGGTNNAGTIFTFNIPAKVETVLHSFIGAEGAEPRGLVYQNGMLYGTAIQGGDPNGCECGTLFAVNIASSAFTSLYKFKGTPDGASPSRGNPAMVGSILYGTTFMGGTSNSGAIFAFDTNSKKETILYSFGGGADGENPRTDLIYLNGLLYGTTVQGGSGAGADGTLFSFDPNTRTKTILHNFGTKEPDGVEPDGLTYSHGAIYGETGEGYNSIFRYVP